MYGCGLASSGSGQGPDAYFYEHDNTLSVSINGGKFVQMSDCQLLNKTSAPLVT